MPRPLQHPSSARLPKCCKRLQKSWNGQGTRKSGAGAPHGSPRFTLRTANWELPDAIARVFDKNQRTGFEFLESLGNYSREALIHRVGPFVGEPKDDDARLVQHSKGEDVAEVEVEGQKDTGVLASAINEIGIRSPFQTQRSNVHRVMTKF
jgi:hypothetical protein